MELAPFTPGTLLALAQAADRRYRELRELYPPGTVHEGRNAAYREREDALACAAWMEKAGIPSLTCVGPFGPQVLVCGSEVTIARGAIVHSTKPGTPRTGVELQRRLRIKVHSFFRGSVAHHDDMRVVQGEVRWAGAGGYWRWTDINNVMRSDAS